MARRSPTPLGGEGTPRAGALSSPGGEVAGRELPRPPSDLLQFLRSPDPRTLLITGPAGAGKTTLALSLLANLSIPSFYISTRVGRGKLLHHFPWLVGSIPPDHLLDLEDVRPASERQEDLLHLVDRMTDPIDPLSAGRRLREFLSFPDPLAHAMVEPPARAGHRILCIDSWEGLGEPYSHLLGLDEVGRTSLDHGLLSLFHAARFSLLLCSEASPSPSLPYLSDGVAELHYESSEMGLLRYLELRKLRGAPIPRSRMVFSLDGGRFTYLPPIPHLRRASQGVVRPPRSGPSEKGALSIGVPFLDRELGPIEPGETVLAEVDGRGASTPLSAILVPLWVRALQDGWSLTLLMDLAHSPRSATHLFKVMLPEGNEEPRLTVLPRLSRTRPEEVWADLLEAVRPHSAIDVSVRTLGALMGETGEALLSRLGQLQVRVRESEAILVLVTGNPNPLLPILSTMVPIHIAVQNYHGTFLIGGRHPPTPNLAVQVEEGAQGPEYRYVPMI